MTARSKSSFIITPRGLRETWVQTNREVQGTHLPLLYKPGERGEWLAIFVVGVLLRVVTLLGRTEDPLHFRIVVEQREENGNSFDNRGSQLRARSVSNRH